MSATTTIAEREVTSPPPEAPGPGPAGASAGTSASTGEALIQTLLGPYPPGRRPLAHLQAELLFFQGQYLLHYRCGEEGQPGAEGAEGVSHEHWKLLTPAALRAAFSGQPVDTGWIPPHVIRSGEGTHGKFAVMWVAPRTHVLSIEVEVERREGEAITAPAARKPVHLRLPLPGLVFLGIGKTYMVWALQEPLFDPAAIAFHAPLPNVYGNGKVCWGENKPPEAGPSAMDAAFSLFVGSPFNGDLVQGRSRAHGNDIRTKLFAVAADELPDYPVEDLVRASYNYANTSIGELIDRILADPSGTVGVVE